MEKQIIDFIKKVANIEYTGDDCGHERWSVDITELSEEAEALLASLPERESLSLPKAVELFFDAVGAWRDERDIVPDNPPMHMGEAEAGVAAILERLGQRRKL